MGFFNNLGALRNREGHRNFHMGSVAPHPITLAPMYRKTSEKFHLSIICFGVEVFGSQDNKRNTHKKMDSTVNLPSL